MPDRALALVVASLFWTPPSANAQLADPIPEPILPGGLSLELSLVASGFTAPNAGAFLPGLDRLLVVDQPGVIWIVDLAAPVPVPAVFLDMRSLVVPLAAGYDERGLLGLALHPDYAQNGRLYTHASEPAGPAPDYPVPAAGPTDHLSVLREWTVPDPGDPSSRPGSPSRVLLRIGQPQSNHNGGTLAFGPDGFLYLGLGDGGGADEEAPGHVPGGNGQDPDHPLASILRIDADGSDAPNGQYGVPDNPFPAGGAPEVFAYGFRNPFRFSFDPTSGLLYAGDVGQNAIEEVDVVTSGGNFGWPHKEGSFFFQPNGGAPGTVTDQDPGGLPPGLIDPIAEYDHDEGSAIIGGFVYRGSVIPDLEGLYLFGDLGRALASPGRLFYFDPEGASPQIEEVLLPGGFPELFLTGFLRDEAGELYVVGNDGGTTGSTGALYRVVQDADDDGHLNHEDNCAFTSNPDQSDVGGVGSASGPDGIGDVCQCGDPGGDGFATAADDAAQLRLNLAGLGSAQARVELCNVRGVTDPSVDPEAPLPLAADCDLLDAVVLRRADLGLAPGIAPVCAPALP